MDEKPAFKIPLGLIILDGLGAVLMGLGFAKMFAGVDFLSTTLQLDDTGWTLIVIGALMMLPFMWHFLVKVRNQKEQTD